MRNRALKKLKILLVEDEEKIALLLKSAIGSYFYKFYIAKSGLEGLQKYQKLAPDIVIADINMPLLSGLDMAKKIREESRDIPIIILSAFSEKEKLFSAIEVGVSKYFLKPYDPDELLDYIENELLPLLQESTIALFGGFVFHKTTASLYKGSRFIPLSKNEIKFLQLLLEYRGSLVGDDDIKQAIWGESVTDERLRTFVRRLRAKSAKELIENIKSQGYRILLSKNNRESI